MASFSSTGIFLVVALSLMAWTHSEEIVTVNSDIQSLLDSISDDSGSSAHAQRLNLPDVSAAVGRIFSYPLGLRTQTVKYKIRELGKSDLPSWLTYNADSDQLEGVPRPEDVGVANIAVIPENPASSSVKHFFTITVNNDGQHLTYEKPGATLPSNREKICRHDDPVTMVTVVIDADPMALDGVAKANVLKKLATHLNLLIERLKLLPLDNRPAYDSSALVAGPGDRTKQEHPGIQLTWQIGCGSVDTDSLHLLEKVELNSQNGKMAEALGHPVIGWHVTNNRPHTVVLRKRRQVPHATPTYQPTPPTKTNDDMDGDLARTVPSMSSPSFSKHPPRRTKTSGRHSGKATKYRYASPVATPTMTPIVPTPASSDTITEFIRPTQVQPSGVETETTPEIPIARTDILVQPSHTVSDEGAVSATPTDSLPTDRYTVDTRTVVRPTSNVASTQTEIVIVPTETINENPFVNRQMKRIEAKYGEVLYHKIPAKTFMDKEDGNTRHLKLMVLLEKLTLARSHWLQFDAQNQVLKGFLLDTRGVGRQEFTYTLAAIDSGSRIARTEFQVVVKRPNYQVKKRINHEFTLKLDANYDVFVSRSSNTIDVLENLGRVFNLEDPYKELNVLRIEPGSVQFTFTMRKVKFSPCPSRALRDFASKVVTKNGTINQKLLNELLPKWVVKGVSVKPLGPCNDADLPPLQAYDSVSPYHPPYNDVNENRERASDGALITYIIPGVIIVTFFIIAIIVACCLYRKRKVARMDREKNHFANKGIPVIFADELEEKPDPPSKPLIMPDEKPPMAPAYMGSRDSPGMDRHRMMYTDLDRDASPPYRPPPPFANSNNHHDSRSKPRSNNHKHPQTYIPP